MNFYKQLLESNGWAIFLLYFTTAFLLNFTDLAFVSTDLVYAQFKEEITASKYDKYDDFVDDFEDELAELDLDDDEVINWEDSLVDTAFIIIEFIFSVPMVAGLFIVGFLFDRKYEQIKYAEIFKIVMLANFIFLLPSLISIFWFMVVQTNYTFQDLMDFKPFYLISLFEKDSLPIWSIGVLNLINLYEIVFVLLVGYGLSISYPFSFKSILGKISLVYLIGLLFWKVIGIYIASTLG